MAIRGSGPLSGAPSSTIWPFVDFVSPARAHASVLFPDPFAPVMSVSSPARSSMLTSYSACAAHGEPASCTTSRCSVRRITSPGSINALPGLVIASFGEPSRSTSSSFPGSSATR